MAVFDKNVVNLQTVMSRINDGIGNISAVVEENAQGVSRATENVSELAESIKQGDTGHLTTWLADIISEGAVPEEIKRATELLEKLTEYKPLAKIEEAEEQNYNMIDNVLNNGVGEKAQREENKRMEEKPTVRLSLKSRLAEKKSQVEGQSKEHDVQENEKKSQREM